MIYRRILECITNLFCCLFVVGAYAQVEGETIRLTDSVAILKKDKISETDTLRLSKKDTLISKTRKEFKYAIRLGGDVSKPLIKMLQSDYSGYELVADFRVGEMLYLAYEVGYEHQKNSEAFFDYSSEGNYHKIGIDYNLYKPRFHIENMVYLGLRYSFANFNQNVTRYQVYSKNQYWEESVVLGANPDVLKNHTDLSSSWIDIIFGIKGEVLNNLYLGLSLRVYKQISNNESPYFPNLWMPGYNKVVSDNPFSVGFNYTISYKIPLFSSEKIRRKISKNLRK